ncbi:MAG: cytochrome c biogenesis protein CcsA [Candidatus Eisenbacteria bacterium]|nr:cytochrome c biogenesis protein CcsA [Candidatus Eisenbacteria bacterium]
MSGRSDRRVGILLGAAVLFLAAALALVFGWAPEERTMGPIQKIFYIHVPSAWVAFLAFFVVFAASIAYLAARRERYDRIAASSAEVGLLFCTLVLITGPIWAKPVWGVWWTWDPRLTSTLVLWFLYLGYFALRSYLPPGSRRSALSAVLGVIGFLDVPVIYFSIRWWRNQHPSPVLAGGEGSGLDPRMRLAFFFSLAAFTVLYAALLAARLGLAERRARAERLLDEWRERT